MARPTPASNNPAALIRQITQQVAESAAAAAAGASGDATAAIAGFLHGLSDQVANGKQIAGANRVAAKAAQTAILEAYKSNVESKKRVASYRQGDRYSGGRLRNVLSSPNFVNSDRLGIEVGNIPLLNADAKHWARLNFGAGPKAESGLPQVHVALKFQGQQIGPTIALTQGPSKPFSIPASATGYFTSGGVPVRLGPYGGGSGLSSTVDEFHVAGSGPGVKNARFSSRPTEGIAARRFLDAGLTSIAGNLPNLYAGAVNDMSRKAANSIANSIRAKSQRPPGSTRFVSPTVRITAKDVLGGNFG